MGWLHWGPLNTYAGKLQLQWIRCSRSITSREVFWDFRLKDLVWEWFGLLLWTSHLPKYQIQPWSHVKWPGWWLGTAIPIFPWGLNCQQLYPPPLGPPDRLSSRLNIFRLWAPTKYSNIPLDAPLREDPESDEKATNFQHIKYEIH